MNVTRRSLLLGGSGTALAAVDASLRGRFADAKGLLTEPLLNRVIEQGLATAKKAGATYADVRIVRRRDEGLFTRENHVENITSNESYGASVRVVVNGAWGFAASSKVEVKEIERVALLAVDIAKANSRVVKRPVTLAETRAHVDVWQTPLVKDPFKIPLADKAELLLAINAEALKVKGIKYVNSFYQAASEWKLFASSEGAYLEQHVVRVFPGYSVTAVDSTSGEFVDRAHELAPMQAGWEYVENSPLHVDARRIAEEAVEKLKAPSVTPGNYDLILLPSNLWLTIHESVGHPTELDRALGYEANFAGTSFATVDKLGKLRFGKPHLNFYADKTTPGALATCGYDDDGVKTQRWDIVKDGLFVAYQTTREQAGWINEKESRGTSYAQDYRSFPFQRMPNVSLAPDPGSRTLQDLIAATESGIVVSGNGSFSIDHQRYNFQFGGQMFFEVKKGRVTRALKDVAYQANTLAFWNSCDLIGGKASFRLGGAMNDGKGEPMQANAVSHGCPPCRFRNVNVLNTSSRRKA